MVRASAKDGGAVFHPAKDTDKSSPQRRYASGKARDPAQGATWSSKDLETVLAVLQAACDEDRTESLASALGVPVGAVRSLSPGWADAAALRQLKAGGSGWRKDPPSGAWVFAERDGNGRLIGLSLRTEDGRKGFAKDAKRGLVVPAGLARLPDPVLVVEGASDVAACVALGLAAVGRPSNASGTDQLAQMLHGRDLLICGENDAKDTGAWPGRDGAEKVARSLAFEWDQPVCWSLPPDRAKDIRSWLNTQVAAGLDLDNEVRAREAGARLLAELQTVMTEMRPEKLSVAEKIVRLAIERYRLGMSDCGEPFAAPIDGPVIALTFRGSRDALRASLAKEYRAIYHRTPNASALSDALTVLEGEAMDAEPELLALRIATLPDSNDRDGFPGPGADGIVIDLGDLTGRAVVVRPGTWEIVDQSPVLFRRTALTGPLPEPERDGDLTELRNLLNCDDESWPVLVGWLVAALMPSIPHPILMLGGEHGTGKSSAARLLGSIVDPSPAPLRSVPRDTEGWAMAAAGSWIVTIDNVSGIPLWWSDALCKVVTGDGWIRRQLYTDSSLVVLRFKRVVILTSIDAGALRGDLGDRLLLVDLKPIPDNQRRTEAELDGIAASMNPNVFGALLDLLASVLKELPHVALHRLPRMADFARVLAAVDRAAPDLTMGKALLLYLGQGDRIAETVVEGDSVAEAVQSLIEREETWSGTSGELLSHVEPTNKPKDWPRNGQAMTGRLKRLRPALQTIGVRIDIPKTRTNRGRIITISRAEESCNRSSPLSPTSQNGLAEQAGTLDGDQPLSVRDDPVRSTTPDRHTKIGMFDTQSITRDDSDNHDDVKQDLSADECWGTM